MAGSIYRYLDQDLKCRIVRRLLWDVLPTVLIIAVCAAGSLALVVAAQG